MEFIKVAETSDLPINTMKKVSVSGTDFLLANVDGSYYAINNRCTHLGGSLADGKLEGSIVKCPKHGSRFDVKTGEAISGPKIAFLKLKIRDERVYPVRVEGNDILIGI
jgi:3-phenylpropionate/trans-cinnamate dioxygenase ferredoxin subunit